MQTNIGITTSYFVGNYYQVENGVVTKYYYAGSQRVALRENGVLNFVISYHLGSTSIITDDSGNVISDMKYKAWGETRYSSGTEQTKYTYTGQYSYVSDFGLHFYNARWYDSSLGRFAQADSIMPGGIQGYDRYAYVNNNPIRYTDPSGHRCAGDGDEDINGHCIVSGGMTTTTSTPSVTTAPVLTSTPVQNNSSTPTNTILVCGLYTESLCDDTPAVSDAYAGFTPLYQFYNWAINNGSTPNYYSAFSLESKAIVARAIADLLHKSQDNNTALLLVGHSAGADTVLLAVAIFLSENGSPQAIKGVVILDSYIFTDDDPNNIWDEGGTNLDEAGVINIPPEKMLALWSGDHTAGFPNQSSRIPINPQSSFSTGMMPVDNHYGLAVNSEQVMNEFNNWYQGLP